MDLLVYLVGLVLSTSRVFVLLLAQVVTPNSEKPASKTLLVAMLIHVRTSSQERFAPDVN